MKPQMLAASFKNKYIFIAYLIIHFDITGYQEIKTYKLLIKHHPSIYVIQAEAYTLEKIAIHTYGQFRLTN